MTAAPARSPAFQPRLAVRPGDRIGANVVLEVEARASDGHSRKALIQCDNPAHEPRWYAISQMLHRPPGGCRRCAGLNGGVAPRRSTGPRMGTMPKCGQRRVRRIDDLPTKSQILRLRAMGWSDEDIGRELEMTTADVQAFARS